MLDVLPANVGHSLCVKLRTHNLCMTFQRCYFLFFFLQHTPICKSRQFATVCTYPQIVDRPRLQCCPRSDGGVSEICPRLTVLTHTHTHSMTYDLHLRLDVHGCEHTPRVLIPS